VRLYNPERPSASAASNEFNRAMTPKSTTFKISWTATIKRDKADVNGFKKISSPASPKMATAAVTVAKISTMMRASSAPTAMS
jgi:hypothetical protein